jgi:hypothetical protein
MDKEKKFESFSIMDPAEKKKMDESVKSVAIDPKQFTNTISSFSNNVQDLPINQFCIKGSVNSAYTGEYITPTMVQYVLSRGCRALDFEVYMDGEERPIVGYSPDQTALNPSSRHTSNKKFPYLRDVLKIAIQSAFNSTNGTAYTTPNKDDPLFINIRLKTDANNKSRLFNLVQDELIYLWYDFRSYFYNGYLDPSGKQIKDLKRKVIFMFENNANGTSLPANNNLGYFYNLLTGTNVNVRNYYQLFPNSSQATPPIIVENNKVITNATNGTIPFTIVLPDQGKSKQPNMNIFSSIQNYGYQMNMMQYYVNDLLLIQNEDIFNTYNGGIVPMAYCLTYTRNYATKDDVIPGVNTVFPTVFSGITRDSWLPNDV